MKFLKHVLHEIQRKGSNVDLTLLTFNDRKKIALIILEKKEKGLIKFVFYSLFLSSFTTDGTLS